MRRFRMTSRGRTNKQNPFTRTSRGGRPPDPRERSRRPRVARFVDAEGCEQRGAVRVASSPHSSSVRSIMENVSSHLLWSSRQHLNRKPSRPIKMRHRPRSVTETEGVLEFSVFSTPERRSVDTLARPAMACHDCGDAASTTPSTRHEEDIEDLGEARGASFRERVPVSPRRDSSRVSLTLSSRNARRARQVACTASSRSPRWTATACARSCSCRGATSVACSAATPTRGRPPRARP